MAYPPPPGWFHNINFTVSLEWIQSKVLCAVITQGELSWICLMKQGLCFKIPWGTESREAIHQAPVPPIDGKGELSGQAHVCGSSGAASPRDQWSVAQ